jgi:hypothetical protein
VWGCVIVAVLGLVVWLLMWRLDPSLRRTREYEAELATREPLPDADMIARHFAMDDVAAEVPSRVRRVFAKHMDYPAEKLLPDDDFAFFWAELDMVDLVRELESGFGIAITNAEAERTPCTIREVSLLVASKAGLNRCSPDPGRIGAPGNS